jgi:hypothetical protein
MLKSVSSIVSKPILEHLNNRLSIENRATAIKVIKIIISQFIPVKSSI